MGDALSPQERQQFADEEPERIGNLNGIPVATRDYASRRVMNRDLDRVRRAARHTLDSSRGRRTAVGRLSDACGAVKWGQR